jgi:hypothetical protein
MKKKSIYKKELDIIKKSIEIKEASTKNILNSPTTIKILNILEEFISKNKFICYGGMAINNILPENKKFYDKNKELPDYDFFSKNAMEDSIKLTNLYFKLGFNNTECKSGLHEGTYKVYVNFLQVADITQLETSLFNKIKKSAINVNEILYAPPNFLRMSIYLELSRPDGDISRWEKIYNRLQLLNKYHPLTIKCKPSNLMFKNSIKQVNKNYEIIKEILIKNGCLFFGGFARNFYKKYDKRLKENYSFDVFVNDLSTIKYEIKNKILNADVNLIKSKQKSIPDFLVVKVDDIIYAKIFKTKACYSYNILNIGKNKIKIATIYTILSMYLIFIYSNSIYFDEYNLLCLSEYLLNIYKQNRLKNKGLLRNYSINCYGTQDTFEKIIIKRNEKFEQLKNNKNSKEYKKWFLRYNPLDEKKKRQKTIKNKKTSNDKIIKGGNKNKLYYFYFEQCPYCVEFDKIWKKDIINNSEIKKKVETEKINKKHPLTQQLNVESFPCLYLKIDDDYYKFNEKRNLKNILEFINDNI